MTRICVIFCATGRVGKSAAEYVLESGHFDIVRLAVRRPESVSSKFTGCGNAVEVVECNLNNAEHVSRAFIGATAVFVTTPDDFFEDNWLNDMRRTISFYAAGVLSASPVTVVCLSSIGARLPDCAGDLSLSGELEDALMAAAAPHTSVVSIRPGFFLSNFEIDMKEALQTGVLSSMYSENMRFPCVAPIDVGRRVGAALVTANNTSEGLLIVNFALPHPLGIEDVRQTLAKLTGASIKLRVISDVEAPALLASFGMPPLRVKSILEMSKCMSTGRAKFDAAEGAMESASTTLETYLKEYLKVQMSTA